MNIDTTIQQIEKLYHRVTGQNPPPANSQLTPSMTEMDLGLLLNSRIEQLFAILQDPMVLQQIRPWAPPVSVWEGEDKILIRVALPGVRKEEVDISLQGQVLMIHGTRDMSVKDVSFTPRLLELERGFFQRSIALPSELMGSELNSSMNDGILEITLSKPSAVASPTSAGRKGKSGNMQ